MTTMKFNDREIIVKGCGPADLEGILHHLRPQSNDWANWYSPPAYKERKFKLVANLLFYYRLGDSIPLGVLVLENFTVQHERPFDGVAFPFSIEFADELQRKHIFSCRCQDEANMWVNTLKSASYEHWRTELIILQKKINMRTGKDSASSCIKNQCDAERLEWSERKTVGRQKSSFQCHLETTTPNNVHNNALDEGTVDLIKF